ncbi:hypothetical protein P2318_30360 [Myxococcaceae bacterium GXIMD 01537]
MAGSGSRRWVGLGALASALALGSACGILPETGGYDPRTPPENIFGGIRISPEQIRERQLSTNRGFNGTIQDIGSSIDPRTAAKAGEQGNSLPVDLAWRKAEVPKTQEGTGGSGLPTSQFLPIDLAMEPTSRSNEYLERLQRGFDTVQRRPSEGRRR